MDVDEGVFEGDGSQVHGSREVSVAGARGLGRDVGGFEFGTFFSLGGWVE